MPLLGELETAIMRVLWAAREPLTVRAVFEELSQDRQLAYTTVMTVLDRLAKKDKVLRVQQGRAWLYRPAATQSQLIVAEMRTLLAEAGEDQLAVLGEFVSGLDVQQRAHVQLAMKAH